MPQPAAGSKQPLKSTTYGTHTASFYSGALAPSLLGAPGAVAVGPDVLLQSGGGRLDAILQHLPVQSGLAVVFYDATAPVSGGPIPASGHKLVGLLPKTWNVPDGVAAISGATNFWNYQTGLPVVNGFPFQSGLCVNLRSGQPGFSVNWSVEIPGQ